jgi:hypothetical protein
LQHFCRSRTGFVAVAGLLALSYGVGTWVRNQRVVDCAEVANRIVTSLPVAAWKTGNWHVRLATPPGDRLTPRYGIYDYSGIETIEVTRTTIKGAQEALRIASGNDDLDVDIVPAQILQSDCVSPKTCFYVFPDGSTKEFVHS